MISMKILYNINISMGEKDWMKVYPGNQVNLRMCLV